MIRISQQENARDAKRYYSTPNEAWKTTFAVVTNRLDSDAEAIVAIYERR